MEREERPTLVRAAQLMEYGPPVVDDSFLGIAKARPRRDETLQRSGVAEEVITSSAELLKPTLQVRAPIPT